MNSGNPAISLGSCLPLSKLQTYSNKWAALANSCDGTGTGVAASCKGLLEVSAGQGDIGLLAPE